VTLPLPFGPAGLADAAVWSVTDLNQAVRGLIEQGAMPVWLRGEVASFKPYSSGHWYFTLQDGNAQVKCVMWRTWAQRARLRPDPGAEVYCFGTPGLWEERGEFRFTATVLLRSDQLGAGQAALERTRQLLAQDGLLDPARKRALPRFPRAVAVVTSLEGAAVRDIVAVARARWGAIRLIVVGTRVQGADAVTGLVRALGAVNRMGVDVCIVGRGGGAAEDLSAFNDEQVCRALAAIGVPTISAVGHETDVTLADLVADVRAATPSNAAELAIPERREVLAGVEGLARRLATGLTRRTRLAHERLARTGDRLEGAIAGRLARDRFQLERAAGRLDALSPLRVLRRGYAVPLGLDGELLRSAGDLVPDRRFVLRMHDGSVTARVERRDG
jgi:exodeoxyribonuclease VII large subunit